MHISPDNIIFWQYGFVSLNLTIVTTWAIMLFLSMGAWLITRKLSSTAQISRWQNFLESVVELAVKQFKETGMRNPEEFLPFLGTLFIFIATSNFLAIFPFYEAPTGSLSTTSALAFGVFVNVPLYGISERGLKAYLRSFCKPTIIMLPFHVMSELSRTLALAVRLFGNVMSESMVGGILLTIAPLFFPVIMKVLGLLTGMVQAYIFSILATVFIAAAMGEE
ncbi:MAG: F0F1 ATP synthase subunit A [Candidatus Riflebacteria bacterium]|nr:F0F1 ATP synthase subunit A [Candidatus Riflebacteria bacterium]